jgi:hypothetical protein
MFKLSKSNEKASINFGKDKLPSNLISNTITLKMYLFSIIFLMLLFLEYAKEFKKSSTLTERFYSTTAPTEINW